MPSLLNMYVCLPTPVVKKLHLTCKFQALPVGEDPKMAPNVRTISSCMIMLDLNTEFNT